MTMYIPQSDDFDAGDMSSENVLDFEAAHAAVVLHDTEVEYLASEVIHIRDVDHYTRRLRLVGGDASREVLDYAHD